MATHYNLLNVSVDASTADIRDAYLTLALALHPDKQPTEDLRHEAREHFQLVNEAYIILSDPNRRQVYDEFGEEVGSFFVGICCEIAHVFAAGARHVRR